MRYATKVEAYSNKIGLVPSLVHFPKTENQADRLLILQLKAEGHYSNLLKNMDKYSFKNPRDAELNAFKKLNELIEYCEYFAEPEAWEALTALNEIKLPLASSKKRYKKQQMKTWVKQDFIRLLEKDDYNFSNKKEIASALLTISSI